MDEEFVDASREPGPLHRRRLVTSDVASATNVQRPRIWTPSFLAGTLWYATARLLRASPWVRRERRVARWLW